MIRRNLEPRLKKAVGERPVVLLHGARQTGKTTLARSLVEAGSGGRYVTLDDATAYAAALDNPGGFIAGLGAADGAEPVVIDEVQRTPELFRAIKLAVDRDRRPGRFLLTGSANALLIPKVSDSLAGRMDLVTLWPLSQGEMEGTRDGFVDAVFAKKLPQLAPLRRGSAELAERILRGGYPEVFAQKPDWRTSWFESYLTTILQRDIRDMANIEGLATMPRLLGLLASRVGSLVNFADLSRSLGIATSTLKRYFTLLEATFLVRTLPPWHVRTGQRLVKSPKFYLTDTGLLSHLLRVDTARWRSDPAATGPLVEAFAVMELTKQATWSEGRVELYHFRTATGSEVDVVLENSSGQVVGVEVKAGASVRSEDFKGIKALEAAAKARFVRGVVLYAGEEVVPFAENMHAVPMRAVWGWNDGQD